MKLKLLFRSVIYRVCLSCFVILVCFASGFANSAQTIIKIENLDKPVLLNNWLYHEGDNLEWSLPNYDDNTWQVLDFTKQKKALPEGWVGVGWFRLHLEFSPIFIESQTPLALLINHTGASEIYLDGKLIESFGVVSNEIEKEISYQPNKIKPCIFIPQHNYHVLAIRYSFAIGEDIESWINKIVLNNLTTNSIFSSELRTYKSSLASLQEYYQILSLQYIFLSINLLLVFAHLIIFYFYRFEKTNLYYSIFLALGFIQQGLLVTINFGNHSIYTIVTCTIFINMLISPLIFAFRQYYLNSILQKGFLNYQILLMLFLIPLLSLVPNKVVYNIGLILFIVILLILLVEFLWSVKNAYKQRVPLLWVFSLSFGFLFLDLVFGILFHLRGEYKSLTMAIIDNSCGISFFLSMSFYIGYKIKNYLDKLNFSLEEKVKERTKELTLSEKREKQANQAKSAFLATMSHEIRTPMNGVIGMANLLMNTNLTSQQREFVETLAVSGEILLNVINDILDFSKIESGKLELEKVVVRLKDCIEDIIKLLTPQAKEKGLELNLNISQGTINTIKIDIIRLRQILVNLIGNAIKFTHQGEINILVNSTKQTDNIYQISFQIKDTGIGIATEQIGKLFQPFTQTDISTTRKYGGTGLGLAISQRLCELMGGNIKVESELNKGSTFYFTILAELSRESVTNKHKLNAIEKPTGEIPLRILVADDNLINQKVALSVLGALGYKADIANNGLEVLAKLEQSQYDVILMDVQMPEMDGLRATREIHKLYQQAPKIIAMTAGAMEADKEQCLAAGMDDYVSKPIEINQLQEVLLSCKIIKQPQRPISKQNLETEIKEPLETVLNYSQLNSLISLQDKSSPNLVIKLIDMFTINSKEQFDQLSNAVNQNDLKTVKTIAHSLASSSGNLGADKVATLCRQLEKMATKKEISETHVVFAKLQIEFNKAVSALNIEKEKQVLPKNQNFRAIGH